MIKFVKELTSVVLEEIPDMVSLAVEISNCQGNCIGCHSPFLRENIGEELTVEKAMELIDDNYGVNCFLFLGEGNDIESLITLAEGIRKSHPEIKLALYSGRVKLENRLFETFDYVKVGPYIAEYGPLNSKTTNQILYKVHHRDEGTFQKENITHRFWKR